MSDLIIIDDDKTEHILLRRIVKKLRPHLTVQAFSYAEDALTFLRSPNRTVPRLIFIDISMPRMDGFDFAERYHALYNELKGGTQVWMMSNSIDPRDRARAEASPVIHGYLDKSSSQAEFERIITEVCPEQVAPQVDTRRSAS